MATLLLLSTAYSLHPLSHRAPRARCCRADTLCSSAASLPPPLRDADAFARGVLDCDATAWWRQDSQRLQILVPLADGVSFKRDVSVDVSRRRLTLRVADSDVAVGELWHEVNVDASDWFVDDAPDFGDARFLVVELQKRESFVDWAAPLKPAGGGSGEEGRRSLIIGGKGEAQKQATAVQLASYQLLQKLPSAVRGDVYAREAASSETLYFLGKVIAEATDAALALTAQEVLVKEHARLYLPSVFRTLPDEEMELWLAPGNSELRVAQNEIPLHRWRRVDGAEGVPAAGACGFEPETGPREGCGVPQDMQGKPFAVRRDGAGRPLAAPFEAKLMAPDEVPGAYEAWLRSQ